MSCLYKKNYFVNIAHYFVCVIEDHVRSETSALVLQVRPNRL